ncbi:hypothetical protein H632_c5055p0 [Helicosporidium sp. ATCC 50920]|nr:hypothetical protein H632_c5055p0 [Helicosporidium sp. ATCC 50920]|eukprot:KDD71426.1 hypothetical protein H632_c5055p0 [Helicosporidium sp. ATCC 50920]
MPGESLILHSSTLDKSSVRPLAQGEQRVRSFSGMGADEDIVVSAARAYVAALNKMVSYLSAQEEAAEQSAAAEAAAAQIAHA